MKVQTDKLTKYSSVVEALIWWVSYCENDLENLAKACIKQLRKSSEEIPQVKKQIEELIQLIETYVSLPLETRSYACELLDTIDMKFKQLLYTSARVL